MEEPGSRAIASALADNFKKVKVKLQKLTYRSSADVAILPRTFAQSKQAAPRNNAGR